MRNITTEFTIDNGRSEGGGGAVGDRPARAIGTAVGERHGGEVSTAGWETTAEAALPRDTATAAQGTNVRDDDSRIIGAIGDGQPSTPLEVRL